MIDLLFVTAHVRSTSGRYCFQRCVSIHRGRGTTWSLLPIHINRTRVWKNRDCWLLHSSCVADCAAVYTLAAIQLQGNSTCKLHCRVSHFAYFWSQLLTDLDVTPLKSKLKFSSTCIWTNLATRGPIMHSQIAKMCPKSTMSALLAILKPLVGIIEA